MEVKGMVMLCGYPHPLYDETLKGWERHEKTVYCRSTGHKKGVGEPRQKTRTEVIWLNPQAVEANRKAKEQGTGLALAG